MVYAETLVCSTPSESAIKIDKFYCTTSPTNNPEILGDVASWIGALISMLMAIFAYRAWKTSQKQLETTLSIALNEHRVPALLELFEALESRVRDAYARRVPTVEEPKDRETFARLFDRWSLTYPELMKTNHLRAVFEDLVTVHWNAHFSQKELQKIYDYLPLGEVNQLQEDVAGLWEWIASTCDEIRQFSFELHSNTLKVPEAITRFEQLKSRSSAQASRSTKLKLRIWNLRFMS